MPRTARLHETGDFHHVMCHSIDSLNLFESDEDYATFITILSKNLRKHDCRCYGFVCMTNHYHLLIRPSDDTFSSMMRRINAAFARYINKTRQRRGFVFWDRFKSIPTRDQNYLSQLLLYIHKNPLSAGMVQNIADLDSYTWSSHSCYRGDRSYSWLNTNYIRSIFSSINAQKPYETFLSEYTGESFDPWKVDEQCDRVNDSLPEIVHGEEAAWIREKVRETAEKQKTQKKLQKQPNILKVLLHEVCTACNVTFDQLTGKRRTKPISNAIALFSYWAVQRVGFSGAFIGRLLGCSGGSILRFANKDNIQSCVFPITV